MLRTSCRLADFGSSDSVHDRLAGDGCAVLTPALKYPRC
ncbi:Protein of unknown function [Pyronema omphalodes CBS 100304]|uniref:Uncharacterized protein n=1 Tax=Pyronema omphalodes (strain CBS 100304) TaxID=1076935 RepID=U4L157_PYROM|nr:Protein of unknown function [Pyronema omphalodes CBS 100304]